MRYNVRNLASGCLLVTLLCLAFGLGGGGCANEAAPGEADATAYPGTGSANGGNDGGGGCVPCPDTGSGAGGVNDICCPLNAGTQPYDPCHNACGPKTACDKGAAKCVPLACDDGIACTTDTGDAVAGCVFTTVDAACDDNNPCTTDACNAAAGGCKHTHNTVACNDGNACTTNDTCNGGTCVGGPAPTCDDNNPCTTNSCDAAAGGCKYVNNTIACNDNNACTTNDACAGGACAGGAALVCNDGNACTADTCVQQVGCVYAPIQGCQVPPCDDGNPCTDDSGNPGACKHVSNTAACNDNNACTTNDTCAGGTCVGGPAPTCDDNNPCTTNSCDAAAGGCKYVNNTIACNDNNACTSGDVCGGGVCLPGAATQCSDNNGCTADACVPATGCKYTPIPAGCVSAPEVCNNGVDDDKDGKTDCGDTDCGANSPAYTLVVYSPGGVASVLPNGWGSSMEFNLQAGQQLELGFLCSELPFAVVVLGGPGGPTQAWVKPSGPGVPVPDLWEFGVWTPWNGGAPTLNPPGPPFGSKDFSVPGSEKFLVRYPLP